jgi:hypothetical protein
MPDTPQPTSPIGCLKTVAIGLATAALLGVMLVNSEFGRELDAIKHRPDLPAELTEGPFFPPPDSRADALAAAVRATITDWSREADAARAEVARVRAEEGPAAAAEIAGQLVDRDPHAGEFGELSSLAEGGTWIISVYFEGTAAPKNGDDDFDKRGPFLAVFGGDVAEAAGGLWDRVPLRLQTAAAVAKSRIKIDHVVGGERAFPYDGGHRGVALDEGLDGIVLRHDDEDPFWFPPSLAMERKVSRTKIHARARYYARKLGGWKRSHTKKATFAAFRTRAWVETEAGGPAMTPLKRGNAEVPEPNPKILRERIKLAAGYLTRETSAQGEITYEYFASDDRTGSGYNILRHAGTVYSMMQAYRLEPDPALLKASLNALRFYKKALQEDKKHPGEWFVRDVNSVRSGGRPRLGRRAKLGGIGLGLCMMAELEKAVPGSVDMEQVRGMGRHLERMQNPDGSFVSFYNWDGKEKSKRKSIYYSGEAILGLLRLHQLTGEERWLDVAVRGADYLVHKRWKSLGIRIYIPMDAWLVQALEEMDRVRPDDARADYAFAIGEAIARGKLMDPATTPPDFLGANLSGPSSMPNAATAGSFGEALSSVARLEARRRPGDTRFAKFAMYNASFQLRNQFWGPNSYYLPNPARSLGGFRVKQDFAEVRNDHVQHNLSGLFGLLDFLDESAPDIGWMVPAAQRSAAAAGGGVQ